MTIDVLNAPAAKAACDNFHFSQAVAVVGDVGLYCTVVQDFRIVRFLLRVEFLRPVVRQFARNNCIHLILN